jgi:hypothetical protein
MVYQGENRLDLADIMDTGKIFLANLSQGQIRNSRLTFARLTAFQPNEVASQAVNLSRQLPNLESHEKR